MTLHEYIGKLQRGIANLADELREQQVFEGGNAPGAQRVPAEAPALGDLVVALLVRREVDHRALRISKTSRPRPVAATAASTR